MLKFMLSAVFAAALIMGAVAPRSSLAQQVRELQKSPVIPNVQSSSEAKPDGLLEITLNYGKSVIDALSGDRVAAQATQVAVFVRGTVPHFYEFDTTQNPNRYGWCGHAALRSVGKYIAGTDKSLTSIHTIFSKNSPNGYAKDRVSGSYHFCAALQDLYWAAQLSQNGGYDRSQSVTRQVNDVRNSNGTYSRDYAGLFQKVVDGVSYNYPPIVPSDYYHGSVGHFWIITGYKNTGDPATSVLYLKDLASTSANQDHPNYEREATVKDFFNKAMVGQSYVQLLFVK